MPVKLHYQVSFLHECELRYGIVETHTRAAREAAKNGELLVVDAILPKKWIIEERFILDIAIGSGEYERYVQSEFDKAMAISDRIEGCKPRKVLRFHINHGYAYYVVTKVTKTLVHLEWRGFSLDRWVEPVLGYFEKMSKERAELLIQAEDQYRRRSDLG